MPLWKWYQRYREERYEPMNRTLPITRTSCFPSSCRRKNSSPSAPRWSFKSPNLVATLYWAFYMGVGLCEKMMNSDKLVPPLAANMSAAFKKVRGAIGASDPLLTDLIVTRIVELAKKWRFRH
jgi:hypothetical protein